MEKYCTLSHFSTRKFSCAKSNYLKVFELNCHYISLNVTNTNICISYTETYYCPNFNTCSTIPPFYVQKHIEDSVWHISLRVSKHVSTSFWSHHKPKIKLRRADREVSMIQHDRATMDWRMATVVKPTEYKYSSPTLVRTPPLVNHSFLSREVIFGYRKRYMHSQFLLPKTCVCSRGVSSLESVL